MPEIAFTVPGVPVPQPRPRACIRGSHASVYGAKSDHAVHAFKATCRLAARQAYRGEPLSTPLVLSLVFVLPRPQGMRWERKPMPRVPHQTKPDLDNLYKSTVDALTGLLWLDDKQIYRDETSKWIAAGDEQPHVRVRVSG